MFQHKKLILSFIIGLLLIAVTLTVLIIYRANLKSAPIIEGEKTQQPQNINLGSVIVDEKEIVVKKELVINVVKIAEDFVERFGSYSSHSNYDNINDLMNIMTAKMKTLVQSIMKQPLNQLLYYSINTKVIKSNLNNQDDHTVNVLVTSQRQELKDGKTNVFYQDANVYLIKDGDLWLVDGFVWK